MRSKISCFNQTAFRKNITRFAPVWLLYTLCLIGGIALTYTDRDPQTRIFWFAARMTEGVPQVLGAVNLVYALLVAELLFGDLFNSRMCNAIHALPLRREGWLVTNLVSGLFFSFVPTVVMALVALPLLMNSIFVGAWKLGFLLLVISNLQFICFFGIATFTAMCVGNRFTMAAGYGLVNAGACIAYWMVDTLYTPMLYGVITPTRLMSLLTPVEHTLKSLYEITPFYDLWDVVSATKTPLSAMTATFTLRAAGWWSLLGIAAVGLVLMAVAVLLYRKRNLECAGDAVAFPVLVPVFQVLCTLFVMVGLLYFLRTFFGLETRNVPTYYILAAGMVVGWIVGKMLVERSTQVFRLKNFYGLGALAAVLALSLVCTHFDILGIVDRLPDPSKVESVYFETSQTIGLPFRGEEAVADMLRIQELALANRPTEDAGKNWRDGDGLYVRGYDGSFVHVVDSNDSLYDTTVEIPEYTFVSNIGITYIMKDGSTIRRRYNIFTENEEGDLARKYLSSWDYVNDIFEDMKDPNKPEAKSRLERALEDFLHLEVDYDQRKRFQDMAEVDSFLEALRADCEAGTIAQDRYYHKDMFQSPEQKENYNGELYYPRTENVSVAIRGKEAEFHVYIYPDSENCVQWLRERDLLNYTAVPNTSYWPYQDTKDMG